MVVIPLGKGRIGRTMGSFSWMGSMGKLFTETARVRQDHGYSAVWLCLLPEPLDSGINGTVIAA